MNKLFSQLPDAIQHALVDDFGKNMVDRSSWSFESAAGLFTDAYTILRACETGRLEAIRALVLELGVDVNKAILNPGLQVLTTPLLAAVFCATRVDEGKGLAVIDFLLAQGADPNAIPGDEKAWRKTSTAMHAACLHPEILQRLVAHGGDVGLEVPERGGLLDEWAAGIFFRATKDIPSALRALDILLANGLSPTHPMSDGRPFLLHCWEAKGVRKHLPELVAKGFDPFERGAKAGPNLHEKIKKKLQPTREEVILAKLSSDLEASAPKPSPPKARRRP